MYLYSKVHFACIVNEIRIGGGGGRRNPYRIRRCTQTANRKRPVGHGCHDATAARRATDVFSGTVFNGERLMVRFEPQPGFVARGDARGHD